MHTVTSKSWVLLLPNSNDMFWLIKWFSKTHYSVFFWVKTKVKICKDCLLQTLRSLLLLWLQAKRLTGRSKLEMLQDWHNFKCLDVQADKNSANLSQALYGNKLNSLKLRNTQKRKIFRNNYRNFVKTPYWLNFSWVYLNDWVSSWKT